MNRAADVAVAGVGLVLTSPLIGLAALATKLEDRGPMLYRQTRVGKDGVDFDVLKLRTMVVGAERLGAGYAVDQGDRRITRVGRILRRTSIDELPQLWNVLRGDMSVIGPRPTLRYQVEQYDEHQRHRLDIRPGLTGWAQVHGRAELPGPSASSSTSGTSRTARRGGSRDPGAHAARALPRYLSRCYGRVAAEGVTMPFAASSVRYSRSTSSTRRSTEYRSRTYARPDSPSRARSAGSAASSASRSAAASVSPGSTRKPSSPSRHDVGNASDPGGDDRRAGRERLDRAHGRPLVDGRQEERVEEPVVAGDVLLVPDEVRRARDPEVVRELLEALTVGTVPDHAEHRVDRRARASRGRSRGPRRCP